MKTLDLQQQLVKTQETIRVLQQELAETNRGLMALTMELEQRVDERTAELSAAHSELKKTNSELMQLTLELEDRVTQRTADLEAANETLQQSHLAALNVMEDAILARKTAEQSVIMRQGEVARRQRAENEIRLLNTKLEQRVCERTAELQAANRELEAFSFSVSHDLRAPLRAIDGFANILLEDYAKQLDAEGQRVLHTIRSEAKRMGQLIDDLLAFSRMSRLAMQCEEVDMDALVQAAFDQCAARVAGRRLQFAPQALPPAQGDPALLRQVLVNLLANAIKFTRSQDVAIIEVGGRVEGQENLYYVKDNGSGFEMKYVHKLFGVFQRLHTEAEFEGTGVGLAIVQRIIHRHGGRVWAEGKVNAGATFYFTLPVMEMKNSK